MQLQGRKYSGNQSYLKQLNITSSIQMIRAHGVISRAELADLLGLNRSTITTIVQQLIDSQLVKEVGSGRSTGGRPPLLLEFNGKAAYVASLDWTRTSLKWRISDLKGELYSEYTQAYDVDAAPTEQLLAGMNKLQQMLGELPPKAWGLFGLGIGVPGIIDRGVVSSYDLRIDDFPLLQLFNERFTCPVIIENIAHAGLIAEREFGCAQGEHSVCYLRLDEGISAGIWERNSVFRGNEGFVGQVGHMVVSLGGRPCVCGNRGCWQMYASQSALLDLYRAQVKTRTANAEDTRGGEGAAASIETLVQALQQSHPLAEQVLDEYIGYLASGLVSLINVLNPGLIILESGLQTVSERIEGQMKSYLDQHALPFPRRGVKLRFSSLGDHMMVYAAIALVIDRRFATPLTAVDDPLEGIPGTEATEK